jgi:hypothetical protein
MWTLTDLSAKQRSNTLQRDVASAVKHANAAAAAAAAL